MFGIHGLRTADITHVHTDESFLYLTFVLDVYSRKVARKHHPGDFVR